MCVWGGGRRVDELSGPVLRDAARLSQRYPPIARYVVFGVSTWPIGCDTPSPPWRACEVEVRYPPTKRVRYPPLRYNLESVLHDMGGYLALGR